MTTLVGKRVVRPFVLRGQVAERVLSSITPGQHWFPPPAEWHSGNEMPRDGFSGILVGRGETPLQEIFHDSRLSLLVNDWTVTKLDDGPLAFRARVTHGVLMRGDTDWLAASGKYTDVWSAIW